MTYVGRLASIDTRLSMLTWMTGGSLTLALLALGGMAGLWVNVADISGTLATHSAQLAQISATLTQNTAVLAQITQHPK